MKVLVDLDVLKKTEWLTDEFTGWTGGRCPICGGYKRGGDGVLMRLHPGEFARHKKDCKLRLAIKSAGSNKACSRRVQGCGVKKYHSKNKVMVGRTRG